MYSVRVWVNCNLIIFKARSRKISWHYAIRKVLSGKKRSLYGKTYNDTEANRNLESGNRESRSNQWRPARSPTTSHLHLPGCELVAPKWMEQDQLIQTRRGACGASINYARCVYRWDSRVVGVRRAFRPTLRRANYSSARVVRRRANSPAYLLVASIVARKYSGKTTIKIVF